jgi:hypothetical protein
MLAYLFVGVAIVAPPPFPPVNCEARVYEDSYESKRLVALVLAGWWDVPEMKEVQMEWNLDSPPEVMIVDFSIRQSPKNKPWAGARQQTGIRVFPLRTHFQGELREVWLRDAYGRVLKRIPVRR